jgi:hypothetical protein
LCFYRTSRKKEGELQKNKGNVKLLNHRASELAPSTVTCQNEEHQENVEEAGSVESSANGDSFHFSQNPNVYRERR